MPMRDRTFSDADVVRIFCKHLTKEERINVVLFFILFSGALVLKSSILDLLAGIPQIRGIRVLIRLLLGVLRIFRRSPEDLLGSVFSGRMRRAVFDCLSEEIKR